MTNRFEDDLQLRTNILEQGLSQLGQGIILITKSGQVIFQTDFAQDMLSKKDGLAIADGKLIGVVEADNKRLSQMRKMVLDESGDVQNHKSFYIHRNNQQKPYLLIMSRMPECSKTEDSTDCILIIIKDTHANTAFWQERLKHLFGLTKREADFAVLLTEGRNIKEISIVMDIVEDTARQYLKNCFKKMDVNKQHELVCLALDSLRKR